VGDAYGVEGIQLVERAEDGFEEPKGHLLVVDDEEINRDLLSRRLERKGYLVTTAVDGREALDKLATQHFDMVLLDIMLPILDGIAVLNSIRREYAAGELPVIMVSAKDDSEGIVEALQLGANDYITKPVDFPVALARIQTHLNHRQVKLALKESEERYALALAGANDGLWDWDIRSDTMYYSARWKAMLGIKDDEKVLPSPEEWFGRIHPDDLQHVKDKLESHLKDGTHHFESEHRILHQDGSYRWALSRGMAVRDANGQVYRMAGSQTDITSRKVYDPLTGLANRILFMDRLTHALRRFKRYKGYEFAVLLLDLDRFKIVNDSLAHHVGDQLLIGLAKRLNLCVRDGDTVARFGGDEFTILLDDIKDVSDATRVAERIQDALQTPFLLEGQEIFTSVSIGIALSATGYETPNDVVRDADTAMNRAKALGKARHEMFDRAMHTQSSRRLQMETDLRRAVEREEFEVYYQAIVDLHDEQIHGFEALVRWRHPEKGQVPPDEFIAIAEETGLVLPIDKFVLRQACYQTKKWQEEFGNLSISVNLSAKQFAFKDILHEIDRVLADTGLAPDFLKLEITESALMDNTDSATEIFHELKKRNVKLGLDDFGTGYSSLSYLHRFPLDTLKIDRSFVSRMAAPGEHEAIVKTIVNLAQNLSFQTVAEGIETRDQLQSLQTLDCLYGQGYYFSKPVPAAEAEVLLRENRKLKQTTSSS
jgi:diguanylate cyclase (GGDEF)-like protein/PAS domain S-box-containing protein